MSKGKLRALLGGLLAFLLALCMGTVQTAGAEERAESRGECVIEASSRRILTGMRETDCLPMASTTKIMTAILILDDCELSEAVEIPRAAEGTEGSSVYLKAGEQYTVEELLYGLMLRSGNDCAVTLAIHHSGSVERFAQRMNEKAARLGATDTHFCNPHGLPAKGHHTTARDLAILASYAMENETFRKIVSTKYYARHNWQNKNKMLWNFDGAIGVKTGFTAEAGRCLVTSAERNGMTLVCVVLNSPQMYERTANLLDRCFADYSLVPLYRAGAPLDGLAGKSSFSYPLTAEEQKKVGITTERSEPLPERSGEFAGRMKIMLENDLLFSQNLYII